MGFFGGSSAARAAQAAQAYLQAERQQGKDKAQELYGQFVPAGEYGMEATQQLRDVLLGGDMSKFNKSPGYQFRLEEGTGAIEKAMAAKGLGRSSNAFKSISNYAQESASDEFNRYVSQLGGFGAQATNVGMQGAGGIMQQYGGIAPGQIASAMQNVGLQKAARKNTMEQSFMDLGQAGAMAAAGMPGMSPGAAGAAGAIGGVR